MTRILTIIALMFATPAWAQKPYKGGDWVFIWDASYAKYYIDRESIEVDGDTIRFVSIQNDTTRLGSPEHYLILEEINCVEKKQRTISLTHWSEPYGRGKLLKANESKGNWIFMNKMLQHPFYGKLCK